MGGMRSTHGREYISNIVYLDKDLSMGEWSQILGVRLITDVMLNVNIAKLPPKYPCLYH